MAQSTADVNHDGRVTVAEAEGADLARDLPDNVRRAAATNDEPALPTQPDRLAALEARVAALEARVRAWL